MLLDMVYSRNWSLEAALPSHDLVNECHANKSKDRVCGAVASQPGNWMGNIAFTYHSPRPEDVCLTYGGFLPLLTTQKKQTSTTSDAIASSTCA